ncbi:MAG: glycosyltransferase, partial [Candidatus Buchananbacteria bacterium]|nr:glycosyltransferase [Candidatus Buchananbacteria bacterium]
RVAGDPIWERIVEKGKRFVSFAKYYEQGLYKVDRPWLFKLIKFTLPRFDAIVFYTPLLKNLYENYYGVPTEKTHLIFNPVARREPLKVKQAAEPTVLFAGRFVSYKNLEVVIRVFDRVRRRFNRGQLILIGDGPDKEKLVGIIKQLPSASHIEMIPKVNQDKLFEYICSAWLGIGPALTEFNPNFILECLSFGKPVLISRENGLSVQLPKEFLFDAGSEQDLEIKLAKFFDDEFYNLSLQNISHLTLSQTWENVINSHRELIYGLIR